MKKSLVLKFAVPVAIATLGLVGAAPTGAQTTIPEETATLTVTKTVVGDAPTDAEFTLHILCESNDEEQVEGSLTGQAVDFDEDITFGAEGGSEDFVFFGPSACTITETDDGGADSSTGPVEVAIEDPILYDAEITNTFDPAETTSTAAAAAAAVEAAPAFTG